jgi:hypothetical protein
MIFELLRKYIYKSGFTTAVNAKKNFLIINNEVSKNNVGKLNFGNNNSEIKFYVIKRSPGAGFFSNLIYILNHLKIADEKKFTPIIDMENFPTNYNQKNNINGIKNLWELYFKPISDYSLKQVYRSKNVFFSPSRFNFFLDGYKKQTLKKIFDKYVQIQPSILKVVNNFVKKNFIDHKNKTELRVTGIHLRGTDQKISARHANPPTIYQIINIIDSKLKNKKTDKFFLLTEELKYYQILKKKYGNLICCYNFFRENSVDKFSTSKRKNHRNRLGLENLIEAITLSKCREIVYCETNISLFSIFYSNFKIKKIHINNGFKSSINFFALFEWHLCWKIPHMIRHFLLK